MTAPRKITIRIRSLALDGATPAQAAPLAAALKAELGRLLSAPGALPPALVSGPRRLARVDAGRFTPAAPQAGGAALRAGADGASIALSIHRSLHHSLHRSLTGGRSR